MSLPLLSVLLPVYNAESNLAESLASLQSQSYHRFEILVVDDGSTDGSAAIVKRKAAADRRIRLLRLPRRMGIAGALNAGLEALPEPGSAFILNYAGSRGAGPQVEEHLQRAGYREGTDYLHVA